MVGPLPPSSFGAKLKVHEPATHNGIVADGATGKKSAVLNFYLYRARIRSYNLSLPTICTKIYGIYIRYMHKHSDKKTVLNCLSVDVYT